MLYSLVTVKSVEQLGEKERGFTSYLSVTRTVLVSVNLMTSKPEGQVSTEYGGFAHPQVPQNHSADLLGSS